MVEIGVDHMTCPCLVDVRGNIYQDVMQEAKRASCVMADRFEREQCISVVARRTCSLRTSCLRVFAWVHVKDR